EVQSATPIRTPDRRQVQNIRDQALELADRVIVDSEEVAGSVERRLRVRPCDVGKPGDLAHEGEHARRVQEVHDTSEIVRGIGIRLAGLRQALIVEDVLKVVPGTLPRLEREFDALFARDIVEIEKVPSVVERGGPLRLLNEGAIETLGGW